MDVQIDRGDIVLGADGAPRYITGDEELLQRVMIRLTARRGGFSPFPELGSTLYQLRSGGKEVVREAVEEAEAMAQDRCRSAAPGRYRYRRSTRHLPFRLR